MAEPTFNGNKIFSSTDGVGGTYVEGVLWVHDYSSIIQELHFNGENGNRNITHGYGDRQWTYDGILSATTLAGLKTLLNTIETQIGDAQAGNYHALVDTYGFTYANAQVRHFDPGKPMKSSDGYLSHIVVNGIIQGMLKET